MLESLGNLHSASSPVYGRNDSVAYTNNLQKHDNLQEQGRGASAAQHNAQYTDVNDIDYERVNQFADRNAKNNNELQNRKGQTDPAQPKTGENKNNSNTTETRDTKTNGEQLSEEENAMVDELKTIDSNVRQHEQAHLTVAGGIATSGASYTYQIGPDGRQYAVGGEVNIDTSTEDTPEATIQKMNQVIAAAMAPADPSGQDFAVASSARRIIATMAQMKNQTGTTADSTPAPEANPVASASTIETPNTNNTQNNNRSNTTNSNNSIAQPQAIEEPTSILSTRTATEQKIDTYKRNNLNYNNNLQASRINVIVA